MIPTALLEGSGEVSVRVASRCGSPDPLPVLADAEGDVVEVAVEGVDVVSTGVELVEAVVAGVEPVCAPGAEESVAVLAWEPPPRPTISAPATITIAASPPSTMTPPRRELGASASVCSVASGASRAPGISGSGAVASGSSSAVSACAQVLAGAELSRQARAAISCAGSAWPSRYSPTCSRSAALSSRAWAGRAGRARRGRGRAPRAPGSRASRRSRRSSCPAQSSDSAAFRSGRCLRKRLTSGAA